MVRAVVPTMQAQRDGRIVNIVGGAARTPGPTFLPGSTANAALVNFTRGIARELARQNIRIVAISPGSTATERMRRLAEQQAAAQGRGVEEVQAESLRAIPLGHPVDPDEVAALAAFVVSDRVASLTGCEILLDGGATPGI
jgi:3-oxoacyl-[acyl-carrier protein] reductase/bacilysin biosynthesis oxidoreductase BacG